MWLPYCQENLVNSDEQYTVHMSCSDQCKCWKDRNKGLSNSKHMFLGTFLETWGLSTMTSHLNSDRVFSCSIRWTYSTAKTFIQKPSRRMNCFSMKLLYMHRHKAVLFLVTHPRFHIFWLNLPQSPCLNDSDARNFVNPLEFSKYLHRYDVKHPNRCQKSPKSRQRGPI